MRNVLAWIEGDGGLGADREAEPREGASCSTARSTGMSGFYRAPVEKDRAVAR